MIGATNKEVPEMATDIVVPPSGRYLSLLTQAWVEGGVLTQQPMDNNRYLLLLGEIMCQVSALTEPNTAACVKPFIICKPPAFRHLCEVVPLKWRNISIWGEH